MGSQPIQTRLLSGECGVVMSSVATSSEFWGKIGSKNLIGKLPKLSKGSKFMQESGIPDKVGP